MRIRIGCDPSAAPVVIDTGARCRVGLVAPPGGGKTTLCRYLARRWLAGGGGPCLALTARDYEFADLNLWVRNRPVATAAAVAGLLLVDGVIGLPPGSLEWALGSVFRVVVATGFGPEFTALDAAGRPLDTVYALLRPSPRRPVQLRLDWPAGTVPVFCDRRRRANFPVHRWAV